MARAVVLGLVAGLVVVMWRRRRRQERPAPPDVAPPAPAQWPPFSPPARAEASATWVAPVEGACPDGYPVKANDRSGIYHVPGGRFYERTRPDRCYAEAAEAEADGYRRAKA